MSISNDLAAIIALWFSRQVSPIADAFQISGEPTGAIWTTFVREFAHLMSSSHVLPQLARILEHKKALKKGRNTAIFLANFYLTQRLRYV